jgi:competence protein ComEC
MLIFIIPADAQRAKWLLLKGLTMNLSEIVQAAKHMLPSLQVVPTRFRAYQLKTKGASFSYWNGKHFTLIEARVTEASRPNLINELKRCNKTCIDTLHITSWDDDHCALEDLREILTTWNPRKIEYPGYAPSTDTGKACLKEIGSYVANRLNAAKGIAVTPEYIKSLGKSEPCGYRNVLFHPRTIVDKANDNSTVQLFRTGCFNVLSLGDVESAEVAALIKATKIACREIDVLILPHHGANNGFITSDLLDELKPKLAVCGVNFDNQYGHVADEIRALLARKGIKLATTVRGDVVVHSTNGTSKVGWIDAMGDNTNIHDAGDFEPKKFDMLQHPDAMRARIQGAPYRSIKR